MVEFTKFISVLGDTLSNPYLYLIAMLVGVIYSIVKVMIERERENSKEKSEMLDKVICDAEETRKLLAQSQKNQTKFAHTLEVQMGEHRHAIKEIATAVAEMRKDLSEVKVDLKGEIESIKKDIERR